MVYTPCKVTSSEHRDEREMSVVYLPKGEMYSDLMGPDAANLDVENSLTSPWIDGTGLHAALVNLAMAVRDNLCPPSADMVMLRDVICRVDVLCLFERVYGREGNIKFNVDKPLLLVNELDNFNSASPLVNIYNPKQDTLFKSYSDILQQHDGHNTNMTEFHRHCVRQLSRLLMQTRTGNDKLVELLR